MTGLFGVVWFLLYCCCLHRCWFAATLLLCAFAAWVVAGMIRAGVFHGERRACLPFKRTVAKCRRRPYTLGHLSLSPDSIISMKTFWFVWLVLRCGLLWLRGLYMQR